MIVNPVLENEMKRSMRSMKGSWIIFGANFILTVVAVIAYFGTGGHEEYLSSAQYRFPIQCYMMMAYALFGMVCLLVPGIAGGSIAIERERRTLEILLTTHLSPWKIVIGKLEASLSVIFLIAVSSMPVISLVLIFGGVSIFDLFLLVLILVISGVFIGSIGIFYSSIIKKTTTATILSYVTVIVLVLGTILFILAVQGILQVRATQIGQVDPVDIGSLIYVLFLNPLVMYFGLLSTQVGSGSELLQICNRYGEYSTDFGVAHILLIAIVLQLIISIVLLILSGRAIDPLRKG